MNILHHLSAYVVSVALALGIISTPAPIVPAQTLGTAVPTSPALYDGYLSANILIDATSMTVTPGTLKNGQTLSGFTCFVIDINQPTVEYVCGTASTTSATSLSVTSLWRGVDLLNPNATSSSLAFQHRRFSSVSISDYPTIQFLVRKMNGTDSLDSPLLYSSSLSTTTIASNRNNVASAGLVADTAFSGAGVINATTGAKGMVQISTGAQAGSTTSLGSTGASLAIPSSAATSTCQSTGNYAVITDNNGKINNGCYGTPTFTGATLAGTTTIASTTMNAAGFYTTGVNLPSLTTLVYATTSTAVLTNFDIFNLPPRQIYRIYANLRPTTGASLNLAFNGDTALTDYSYTMSSTTGSAASALIAQNALGQGQMYLANASNQPASSTVIMDIIDGNNTVKAVNFTTVQLVSTTTSPWRLDVGGVWATTTPGYINRMRFSANSNTLMVGSSVYIYASSF